MSPQQLGLALFFALLFVVVLPIFTARSGGSLFGPLKRTGKAGSPLPAHPAQPKAPYRANGNQGELLEFMAALLRTATRNGMQLVCPGTLEHGGKQARFSALLVGSAGVVGIYCLGFGGRVTSRADSGGWQQTLNGSRRALPDYFQICEEWRHLGRAALNEAGLQQVPFSTVAVFTNKAVELDVPSNTVCFRQDAFLQRLRQPGFNPSHGIDAAETARRLAKITKKEAKPPRKARSRG